MDVRFMIKIAWATVRVALLRFILWKAEHGKRSDKGRKRYAR